MRYRPFPTEEDLASIDEEALKAKEEAEKEKKDDEEEEEYVGEIQLSKKRNLFLTVLLSTETRTRNRTFPTISFNKI